MTFDILNIKRHFIGIIKRSSCITHGIHCLLLCSTSEMDYTSHEQDQQFPSILYQLLVYSIGFVSLVALSFIV
jgi:hypothetical protein